MAESGDLHAILRDFQFVQQWSIVGNSVAAAQDLSWTGTQCWKGYWTSSTLDKQAMSIELLVCLLVGLLESDFEDRWEL